MCVFIRVNILTEIVQTHLRLVVVNCRQINWTSKCTKLQMTALWDVWKQFLSPRTLLQCARHTSRPSTIGVVKWDRCWGLERPPVGYWEWWFGRGARDNKGRRQRGRGFSFHYTWPGPRPGTCSARSENGRKVPFVVPNANLHSHSARGFRVRLVRTNEERRGIRKTAAKPRRSVGFKHLRGARVE